jgi:hypothetical protein
MYDEILDREIKKSPMWEVNNPRVNALIRATMDIVYLSKNMKPDHKQEVFNVLISCIRIYSDPELYKKDIYN